MNSTTYYIISALLVILVLAGINLMSKPKLSVKGNLLSICAVLCALILTAVNYEIRDGAVLLALGIGGLGGLFLASKTQMISMPQVVALLNGLGGLASACVALSTFILPAGFAQEDGNITFSVVAAGASLFIGALTFSGSLIAAGKLARVLDAKPKKVAGHSFLTFLLLVCIVAGIVMTNVSQKEAILTHQAGVSSATLLYVCGIALFSLFLGVLFVMRVGGADMPITISLLNSFSGVAGGIAGMAVGEPLLICLGGVVGASGLILTQDMCKAMNRSLRSILTGATTMSANPAEKDSTGTAQADETVLTKEKAIAGLKEAKKVILIPGYGMALSQAQMNVAKLAETLEKNGAEVKFAIHPVAGRMPGHMSVLLCEADIPYEKLCMMEDINSEFATCDAAIVIGANDVTNPAANTAEGTPIYGMPVLNVSDAPLTIVCNFDLKPGYAGVDNPLYTAPTTFLMLGDAKESVDELMAAIG